MNHSSQLKISRYYSPSGSDHEGSDTRRDGEALGLVKSVEALHVITTEIWLGRCGG
jgi:hypothetical protein